MTVDSGSVSETRLKFFSISFLLLATFAAHFLLWQNFGLYEDDFHFIGGSMAASSWSEIYQVVNHNFSSWSQGRPLGLSIPRVISYLGAQVGGLQLIYLVGFSIIAVNVCLTFLLLRRFSAMPVAVIGALLFSLYPADTTKILLTHSLILQVAWTCTLAATLAYLNNRKIVFYCLAFLPLMIYESIMLPLFAIPLLRAEFTRTFFIQYAKHVLGLLLLIAAYASIRYFFFHEGRLVFLTHVEKFRLAETVLSAVLVGPFVSASTFLMRPVTVLVQSDVGTWLFIAMFFLSTWFFLSKTLRSGNSMSAPFEQMAAREITVPGGSINVRLRDPFANAYRLIATGLVMWPVSYLLAFTHWPQYSLVGRLFSSMHIAATLAAPLLVSGVLSIFIFSRNRNGREPKTGSYLHIALSLYISLLAGFQFLVQQDYVKNWTNEKRFWSRVISLTPDINEKSVVLVPDRSLEDTNSHYILARSWANFIMFHYLYRMNNPLFRFGENPRVVFLDGRTVNSVKVVKGELFWNASRFIINRGVVSEREKVDPDNIILLRLKNGKLERYSGWVNFGKVRILVHGKRSPIHYPETYLYHLVMDRG